MGKYKETVCSCDACKQACVERPCWPSPRDAKKLMEAGYSKRLMLDYWVGGGPGGEDIFLVSPAIIGSEGRRAPRFPFGQCTFYTKAGLCKLHKPKLKPLEGRVVSCKHQSPNIHFHVAQLWNNKAGRALVKVWKRKVGLE